MELSAALNTGKSKIDMKSTTFLNNNLSVKLPSAPPIIIPKNTLESLDNFFNLMAVTIRRKIVNEIIIIIK